MSSRLNDFAAGALGGVSGLVVGHPLDTIKVILQTKSHSGENGSTGLREQLKIFSDLNNQGLVRGFFRGLGIPLYSYVFLNSTYFGVYGAALKFIEGGKQAGEGSEGTSFLRQGYWAMYWAGCAGGFAQCFIVCPAELVKVVLQSQAINESALASSGRLVAGDKWKGPRYFSGPMEASRWVIRHHGPLGFFRGFNATLARDCPLFGLYIVVYEYLRNTLQKSRYADSGGIWSCMLAGGFSGMLNWTLALPADVVKSRYQADITSQRYRSSFECCKEVWRVQGPMGFTAGLGVMCVRAFPVNAVTFLVYTKSLEYLEGRNKRSECDAFY